ncbi:MAG: polyphosphate polymerase domain-containing protein [Planctomycetes bacterium]|nr:polyphosphate polymerase domain-containing protein [Planctomycetota bacterium]
MVHGRLEPLRFRRYECKYLISQAQAVEVRRAIRPHTEPDSHGRDRPGFIYPVCSLYVDSPDLRLHRQTQDGICDRYKLRIRGYDDDPEHPLFVEIKSRRNTVVTKARCPLRREHLPAALGLAPLPDGGHGAKQSVLVEFVARVRALGAVPMTLVRYEREAYQGLFDDGHRLTMDFDIRSRRVFEPCVEVGAGTWDLVSANAVVLELKFNDRLPGWMAALIRRLGLDRTSYSKYGHSVLSSWHGNMLSV